MAGRARMLLFLDVDGVLLGKKHPRDIRHSMAAGCEAFIDFALARFDCYWLTSHCRGDAQAVIDYLRSYADASLLAKLARIRPTHYRTFKTEALHGDFLWLDDAPTACEFDFLEQNGMLHRWMQVDTRREYAALGSLVPDLEAILERGFDIHS